VRRARRVPVVAAAALLSQLACTSPPSTARTPEPARAARGVVLISIDTLRADHVGAVRAGVPLTPSIDGMARGAIRFTDALANCTVTRSSHASMLTGLYPWRHGIPDNSGALRPGVTTLAETLGARGVATGAVVSSFPMRELARGFGTFHQAFDHTVDNRDEPVASPGAATEAALGWLRAHGRESYFLFVHYFPPHGPYNAPARFRLPELEAPSGRLLPVSRANYEHGAIPAYQRLGEERDPAVYRARYAARVRLVDHHVGRLLDGLRALGLYDESAILLTSDHGESLGERGWWFCHGNLTYREQSAVPLLLKLPGGARARAAVGTPVQGVDLFPTVLALLGGPAAGGIDGVSLLEAADGRLPRARVRFTQSGDAEQLSVLEGPWKLTRVVERARYVEAGHPRRALYRLDRDPEELRDLAAENPQVTAALEGLVGKSFTGFGPKPALDRETEERLRALGYVN
jgi:arylsulfatase A-like enzyme